MGSPPNPWERAGAGAGAAISATNPSATAQSASTTPTVPDRPATLSAAPIYAGSSLQSPYGGVAPYSRFGTSTYGGMGSYGGMPSYGGFGTYGGVGSYGGLGSYGGMGTYGSGYGGYGNMGMMGGMPGMMGPNGLPMDPNGVSLTQTLEATTQHTFALLHSIVQTFSGVAQMLESTFMATHSSFFAMVGVIDQFGQLRNALGSVLGLFGLIRWMKDLLTGRTAGGGAGGLQGEFKDFINGRPIQGLASSPPPPKASKKPLIVFFLAIFGIPYAMTKLVKILAARTAEQQQQLALAGQPLGPLDPSSLTFARSLYPFTPNNSAELALKENEIVAIMGKLDPQSGTEVDPRVDVEGSEWWKGRTREGREGWFPKKWVEVLERKDSAKAVE